MGGAIFLLGLSLRYAAESLLTPLNDYTDTLGTLTLRRRGHEPSGHEIKPEDIVLLIGLGILCLLNPIEKNASKIQDLLYNQPNPMADSESASKTCLHSKLRTFWGGFWAHYLLALNLGTQRNHPRIDPESRQNHCESCQDRPRNDSLATR